MWFIDDTTTEFEIVAIVVPASFFFPNFFFDIPWKWVINLSAEFISNTAASWFFINFRFKAV